MESDIKIMHNATFLKVFLGDNINIFAEHPGVIPIRIPIITIRNITINDIINNDLKINFYLMVSLLLFNMQTKKDLLYEDLMDMSRTNKDIPQFFNLAFNFFSEEEIDYDYSNHYYKIIRHEKEKILTKEIFSTLQNVIRFLIE